MTNRQREGNGAVDVDARLDAGGCTLAGSYVEVARPVAAALLISGSGRSDRNSDARLLPGRWLRIGLMRAVAESLAATGVSSLRYDKRGVGASAGDYLSTGMDQRLADARAARDWLATRAAGLPLLAVGHSEGTYYAAQLAADGEAAGAVLLSGPVHTGREVLAYQTDQIAARLPTSAKVVLKLLRTDPVRSQRENLAKILAAPGGVVRVQGVRVNARWMKDFVAYDPGEALARITVPVLAITGAHDLQLPPDDVDAMKRLVRGPFEGHVVVDLSHLMRPDPDCLGPRGYRRQVRQPVSPAVLQLITTWVARYWGQP